MDWNIHIERLKAGITTQFRPRSNSMRGRVPSGALCTVAPVSEPIIVGDIVVCRVKGNSYLHLVQGVRPDQYLIGNNVGGTNGWISSSSIFGKLVRVDP